MYIIAGRAVAVASTCRTTDCNRLSEIKNFRSLFSRMRSQFFKSVQLARNMFKVIFFVSIKVFVGLVTCEKVGCRKLNI